MESYGNKECPRPFFAPFFVARKYFISEHISRECEVLRQTLQRGRFYPESQNCFRLFFVAAAASNFFSEERRKINFLTIGGLTSRSHSAMTSRSHISLMSRGSAIIPSLKLIIAKASLVRVTQQYCVTVTLRHDVTVTKRHFITASQLLSLNFLDKYNHGARFFNPRFPEALISISFLFPNFLLLEKVQLS